MIDSVHIEQSTHNSVYINTFIWLDIIIIHVLLFVAFNAYHKYRATILRQKVATLEKLWLLEINKKKA
ncbi:hypothetical protein H6G33_31850 [Calothrix sp. FACHB-1219]|uniref:Uncharacterized protein n=2 Tax=Calothrix TaxID=1186 RepID=A0ABR8AER2_9CYAN|nr:hypothetical protein [Calothrix parietina FACHB-288]MBD2208140.1 hypothetical protein [Calothrix sp. FACHB-168]MBD2221564.1 hypothetical protein [Calothrix sp. FACHB-1219]MBD2226917.1 hypothetical protein [Calothrix anomala FACHB-343]